MKKKTYKTLAGLLRANGAQQFTMSDFLSGEIYNAGMANMSNSSLPTALCVSCLTASVKRWAVRKESTTRYSTT